MLKILRIGDLGEICTGNTPSKKNNEFYESEDIMFIKPDILSFDIKIINKSNEYISEKAREKARIIPKGSLLVSCIGNIGKLGINNEEVSFNQQINAIIHNDKIFSSKYLAYLLKYNQKKLEAVANAPVVPIINKSQFSDFQVMIHEELGMQKKIVTILDKSQKLIDKRKKQIEELDELVKSRFIEMFGDPISNSKNFNIVTLNEVSELITKGASPNWQGIEYVEDETQTLFVTSENVREGYLDLAKKKYLQDEFNEKQKRSVLKKGDFLINIVGASIGRAAQFNLDVKANINQAVALVRIGNEVLNDKYLLTYLNSPKALQMYNSMQVSVARANLSLQNINDLEIILPPIELQNQFADFVKQVDKLKFEMDKSLKELEHNFNSLMQKAFKGELF